MRKKRAPADDDSREFVDRISRRADDLALLLAHEPDDRVVRALARMRSNLEREMAGMFDRQAEAAGFADYFIGYVMKRRRGIESVSVAPSRCT